MISITDIYLSVGDRGILSPRGTVSWNEELVSFPVGKREAAWQRREIADCRAGTRAIFISSRNGNAIGHFAHTPCVSSTREPLYRSNEQQERVRERGGKEKELEPFRRVSKTQQKSPSTTGTRRVRCVSPRFYAVVGCRTIVIEREIRR